VKSNETRCYFHFTFSHFSNLSQTRSFTTSPPFFPPHVVTPFLSPQSNARTTLVKLDGSFKPLESSAIGSIPKLVSNPPLFFSSFYLRLIPIILQSLMLSEQSKQVEVEVERGYTASFVSFASRQSSDRDTDLG
jgi:hypothetical protein